MNSFTNAKIKRGVIVLPQKMRKAWDNTQAVVFASPDSVYIKKVSPPSFSSLSPELKKLGKIIKKRDIEEAIAWARKKTYDAGGS